MTEITADTFKAQVHDTFPTIEWQDVQTWTMGTNPPSFRIDSKDNIFSVIYNAFPMTWEVSCSHLGFSGEFDFLHQAKEDLSNRINLYIQHFDTLLSYL